MPSSTEQPKVNHSNRKGSVYISQNVLYNNHSFFINSISANLNPNEMKFEAQAFPVRYSSVCNLLQVAVIRLLFVFPYCLATPVLEQDLAAAAVSALLTLMEWVAAAWEKAQFCSEAKSKLMVLHSVLSEWGMKRASWYLAMGL